MDDQITTADVTRLNDFLITGDSSGNVKKHLIKTVVWNGDHLPTGEMPSDWFINCHWKVINSLCIFTMKDGEEGYNYNLTFFVTSSDDCNVFLYNFDGIFIGKFGQNNWNIYEVDQLIQSEGWKRRDVDVERVNWRKYTDLDQLKNYVEKFWQHQLQK